MHYCENLIEDESTVTKSESKNKYNIYKIIEVMDNKAIDNYAGAQVSYNIPKEFFDICKEKQVIKFNQIVGSGSRTKDEYILVNEFKLILGKNILKLIGEKYQNVNNKLLIHHATNNKPQLFKSQYEKHNDPGCKWFSELYDNNIQGNLLHYTVNLVEKTFEIDIEFKYDIANVKEKRVNYEINLNNHEDFKNFGLQLILFGPPGTGKSFQATKIIQEDYSDYSPTNQNNMFVFRTTIHSEYSYFDFVGSILPRVHNNDGDKTIEYKFTPGIFTQALKTAFSSPTQPVYLVLEEMSRGNIASIFGDIFQLLDRDSDGVSEYSIKNDLIQTEVFPSEGKDIYLPRNLNIIGTVNTSDQNVFVMDNAFKRRFEFEYVDLDPIKDTTGQLLNDFVIKLIENGVEYNILWSNFYQSFNKYIVEELSLPEDKQIGQFFIKFKENDDHYNNKQLYNKLLQYIWNDVNLINDSGKNFISKDIRSFSQAYKKLKNNENIFSENFLQLLMVYSNES
ncbi:McrB family protein [Serpentinicella alkaliphila]|uniref:Dynein-related subfamily AAA family protein n=1 Tax=Serpentinicella alkaliphila TaxID=1734049 RepID=A0A4R2TKM2_9FIRM|nr:AAA family ATPase [Serpentinicella alkaliphila]QUH26415.1 AAA family ATPase [Serpentinicella alkaliphila]TCP97848.1 dynein-related subfamily AAA family protein [Serpentinicella alkaliphila]